MLLAQLCFLLALLVICSFVPGFFFVRRLRWTPLEKLCGSIGLSMALVYLAAWTIYCFGPGNSRSAFAVIALAIVGQAFLVRSDVRRFAGILRIRQAVPGYAVLLVLTLLMLGTIRVYSGAGPWSGDWAEHFQRSLFFLNRLSPQVLLLGNYSIPARPPMMNVVAAFYLGLTEDRFALFQVAFAFLNLLIILPSYLLLPSLQSSRRREILPLLMLFAASPMVMENVTYTWSKALTGFYVVLGLSLYLAGLRKNESTRIVAAFLAFACAILVHYSAGPYVLLAGIHYLVRFFRRRPLPWKELALTTMACSLFVATWFGWSVSTYGTMVTATANPYSTRHDLGTSAWNIYATIVPVHWRGDPLPYPPQHNFAILMRDEAFLLYQHNLIFSMGLMGGPLVVWLLLRAIRGRNTGPEWAFWRWMIPSWTVLGIAIVADKDVAGVPESALLTVEVLGLSLLAANFWSLRRNVRMLLIVACLIDFTFGVFLQARVQAMENTPDRRVFGELQYADGHVGWAPPTPDAPAGAVWLNWMFKHHQAEYQNYLKRWPEQYGSDPAFQQIWPPFQDSFLAARTRDVKDWGGWFSRNDGVLFYLGDFVAGSSGTGVEIASVLFALSFLSLAGMMIIGVRRSPPEPAHPKRTSPAP